MAAGDEENAWLEAEIERQLQSISVPDTEEDDTSLTDTDLDAITEDSSIEVSCSVQ